ncbi:PorT family protein [Psychroserpens burtonensis]|uniref:PorT family protein n=1 Tax=Psychroserpens burtonensis TaxID=49278 RepID=A0A5C7BD12_9FLAO|nr:porin family protein [Psychroserpens burtonensis]TXE20321.1 PorT family protein [Psychroserpens burtonensis]
MKKLLLLSTIAIFGISNLINGQNIDFGFKTGLNISNIAGGETDRNNLFVFHIGGFAEFKINEKFSLQPELLYSRQGSEVGNSVKIKLDYLAIPLMAKYYLSKKISLEAGPQISFLVNDKFDFNESSISDADTDASSFDFGLNFGFGYNINSKLSTQVRYNYGITTISENPDIKNSVFQISLGYRL